MALYDDPKKKKPYDAGVLPGAKLIPGSTAASVVDAVGGFKANYNAKLQTGEQTRLANNLNFINPADPASMKVAPPAVQRPAMGATTAPTVPATASATLPMPSFANVAGGSKTSYGPPANPARRPGSQAGAGAPSAAGTAALRPGDANTFTGSNGVTRPVPGTMTAASNQIGSVQSQNFGNAAVPQAQASIARPGAVASTYGLSVNDPRANDQNAASISRPAGTLRGPDAMGEQYASREAREAAQKLMGDMDTDLFRLSFKAGQGGRNGRAAMEAMGGIRNQQNNIAGGLNKIAADATQGRADRDNTLANTGLEQQGADRRAAIDFQAAQMGDATENRRIDVGAIERPTLRTDANGNLLSVAGTAATNVMGADGQPVREAVQAPAAQRDYGQEAFEKLTADLIEGQRGIDGALPPNATELAVQQAQAIRAASGGGQAPQAPKAPAPAGMKQVGTSGGKPVYEDAKGNRFTL